MSLAFTPPHKALYCHLPNRFFKLRKTFDVPFGGKLGDGRLTQTSDPTLHDLTCLWDKGTSTFAPRSAYTLTQSSTSV